MTTMTTTTPPLNELRGMGPFIKRGRTSQKKDDSQGAFEMNPAATAVFFRKKEHKGASQKRRIIVTTPLRFGGEPRERPLIKKR